MGQAYAIYDRNRHKYDYDGGVAAVKTSCDAVKRTAAVTLHIASLSQLVRDPNDPATKKGLFEEELEKMTMQDQPITANDMPVGLWKAVQQQRSK